MTGMTALVQARGWRGLVPLRSTRADVEQLLGQPAERISKYSVFYRGASETVIITYAKGLSCGKGEKYSQWRVPRDTVESILVTPTTPLPLSELAIDQRNYEKRSGGHRPEDVYYINDQEGESIRVFLGKVMEISLYPGRIDAHLSCFELPPTPAIECEGLTPPALDFYGNVPLEREKPILDNFAISLLRERNAVGYIIAYAGKRARAGEAKDRAERAKNYLIKVRSLSANRLKAIDGGYRKEPQVELYVIRGNVCPPTPAPTLDPRDVQIIRVGKPRKNRRST
jgi:hypothetical protein